MLTVLPAIAGTHSIPLTLKAFRRVQQQFGVFPLPTEATILAAELLCVALTGRNVDLGAVGVVEVQASGLTTFLAAASGAGQIPADAVVEWQAAVREKLINPNSTLHTVSCMALTTEATFYVPAHQTTAAFIKEAFEDFAIPGRPLTYADLKTTINEIKQMPSSPFGVKPDGSVLPAGYRTEMVPVKKLLAIAVAMRIKAFDRQALADARNALDRLYAWLDRHPYPDRTALAENIGALIDPFRDDPNRPISTNHKVQSVLKRAWEVADLSRYCAEPKLFTYLRTVGVAGSVVGQLAMWWDSTRPNRYGFPHSEKSPYASYMLPCSSCQARSGEIMAGIPLARTRVAEEPVRRPPAPAQGRQRRHSMRW